MLEWILSRTPLKRVNYWGRRDRWKIMMDKQVYRRVELNTNGTEIIRKNNFHLKKYKL
jgi:hypothetical protein